MMPKKSLTIPPLIYLLVSLLATWPLITHLRGWVPGHGDWGQNMWALWWTRHALLSLGQSPFYTRHLFHPEGVTLLFHPLDVSDGLLALPLYGLAGGDIAYNLLILLSFLLGGWGAYLLALHLTHNRIAALVAGLVFALSPYHLLRIHLGHLNLSSLQWLPFFALFLLRFVRTGSPKAAGLAIFFMVFTALNSWYYVVYGGMLAVAVLLWPGAASPPLRRGWRVGLVVGGAGVILLPLIIPMVRLLLTTELVGAHNPLRHSADLLSFWIPGPPSTWAGWFEGAWQTYAAQNREPGASAYLGYAALTLSLLALLHHHRGRVLWWLTVGVGFSLLAMGPRLQVNGLIYDTISLPYSWLATLIPIFSITGIPGRFVVMTSLALAVLTAYGLAALRARLTPQAFRAVCLGAALVISLEYLAVPLHLSSTALPNFYQQIAAEPGDNFVLIDTKWDANYLLHAQTVHRHPLVGGWLARLPAEQAAYLDQGTLADAFVHLLVGPDSLPDPARLQAALAERNVRYIIAHGGAAGPWLEQAIGWPIVYEDDTIVVYSPPPR